MNYRLIENPTHNFIECLPDPTPLSSAQNALDLVGGCGEYGVSRLLIPEGCLSEDFYNLKTGLAGEVLLKFSNYRIKAAAVIPNETVGKGKFYEFALETNRGRDFRIFQDYQKAVDWLIQD
jgi:hypothetical protein